MVSLSKIPTLFKGGLAPSSSSSDYVLDGLAIIAMLFFLSLSLSYAYPLVAIVNAIFALIYTAVKWKSVPFIVRYFLNLRAFIKLPVVLYILMLLSFFLHAKRYFFTDPLVESSVYRAISFSVYAIVFFVEISKSNIDVFLYKFSRYTAICVSMVSVFSLIRFYLSFRGVLLEIDPVVSVWTLFLTSLAVDYNFYALGIFSGVFSILYLRSKGFKFSVFWLFVMTAAIYFSGSRRAILVGLFLIIYFVAASCLRHKKFDGFKLVKKMILLFVVLGSWVFLPSFIQENFSYETKKSFFEHIGLRYNYVAQYLPVPKHRYLTLINKNAEIEDLRNEFYRGKDTFSLVATGLWDAGDESKDVEIGSSGYTFLSNVSPTDGGRLGRWLFAIKELRGYSSEKLLFGNGAEYHLSFAEKFSPPGEVVLDYPHNPFLSMALYSGVLIAVGLVIVFFYGYSFFLFPNAITLGLFLAAYFFNVTSLDLLWANYHFPFILIFGVKLMEIVRTRDDQILS